MRKFLLLILLGVLVWYGYPQRFYDAREYWGGRVQSLSNQMRKDQAQLATLNEELASLNMSQVQGTVLGLRLPPEAIEKLKEENLAKQERIQKNIQARLKEMGAAQAELAKINR